MIIIFHSQIIIQSEGMGNDENMEKVLVRWLSVKTEWCLLIGYYLCGGNVY